MIILRENEKIIKIVRQHYFVMVRAIAWSVVFAGFVLSGFFKFNLDVFGYSWEIIVGAVLIVTLNVLYKIYIWRKNILIITNQRVVFNARQGIFSRTVTEVLYRDIYDISFKQTGLSALLNRYGKLTIKMPSGSEITFDKTPSPAGVVDAINNIRMGIKLDQSLQNES